MIGHEKEAHLNKKKKLITKKHRIYVENPKEGIKKP